MRVIKNIGFAIILAIAFNSCFTAPTYPVVPQIEILNDELYFGKAPEGSLGLDSISLSIRFKDGDGDLGLNDDDKDVFKYALKYNYLTGNGNSIINYKFKRENPSFKIYKQDTLPLSTYNFVTPYNCTNWEVIRNANNVATDTVFVIYNQDYYNIFIDFEIKNPNGTFTRFDPATYFKYPNCSVQGFNARFPILSKDPGKKSPLDGKITYALKSLFFEALFSIKTIRMVITIQDRALHKSNTVITKEFTLAGITRKG